MDKETDILLDEDLDVELDDLVPEDFGLEAESSALVEPEESDDLGIVDDEE